MALVKRRMSRKKVMILGALFGVLLIGGFWYLFGVQETGITGGGSSTDPATERLRSELRELKGVHQDLLPSLERLYDDARFQALTQYGEVPVPAGTTGRPNPFQPL